MVIKLMKSRATSFHMTVNFAKYWFNWSLFHITKAFDER